MPFKDLFRDRNNPFSFFSDTGGKKPKTPKTHIRTADAAITRVIADNMAFMEDHPLEGFFDHFLDQQTPFATLVLCSDSRCQLEAFCSQPFNSIFEVSNAGNRFKADMFSVSFGVKVLKTPLLLIIGHTDCGAIKAAMADHSKLDAEIQAGLDGLNLPAHSQPGDDTATYNSKVLVNVIANVNAQVRAAVDTYSKQVADGNLSVVGALFDIHNLLGHGNGKLHIFNVSGETAIDKLHMHKTLRHLSDAEKKLTLLDISKAMPVINNI
ncbi:MAG: hypothetical protein GC134_03765 [Proteobacteria bacterium]|nr:hypothetical protein [Pseudomonadota bacterium]